LLLSRAQLQRLERTPVAHPGEHLVVARWASAHVPQWLPGRSLAAADFARERLPPADHWAGRGDHGRLLAREAPARCGRRAAVAGTDLPAALHARHDDLRLPPPAAAVDARGSGRAR